MFIMMGLKVSLNIMMMLPDLLNLFSHWDCSQTQDYHLEVSSMDSAMEDFTFLFHEDAFVWWKIVPMHQME
jgi:hypothetical protein